MLPALPRSRAACPDAWAAAMNWLAELGRGSTVSRSAFKAAALKVVPCSQRSLRWIYGAAPLTSTEPPGPKRIDPLAARALGPVKRWFEERCVADANARTSPVDAYADYAQWAKARPRGERAFMPVVVFGRAMAALELTNDLNTPKRVYYMRLKRAPLQP